MSMGAFQQMGPLLSGVAAIAGVVGAAVSLKIAVAVAELRTDLEKARREDRREMEEWVEERFVRRHQSA